MKLVASAIVRNELDRYLTLWIEHLLEFCDEIRLLDDNSDDGTFEWLNEEKQFLDGVRVLRNQGPAFFENEGRARQELLEWTVIEGEPDFVLSIDADEFVGDPGLARHAAQRNFPVITLQMEEVWSCNESNLGIRVDGLWGNRKCPILWRAPRRLGGDWSIPDRKLACGREPIAVRRTKFKESGSSVFHFGWTRTSERQARAERYFEHDKGKFHQDRHLQSILYPDDKVVLQGKEWPSGLESFREDLVKRADR